MSRVTIEDCLKVVKSKFYLVLFVAQRAQDILSGSPKMVDCSNKEIVTALKEISTQAIDVDVLEKKIIEKFKNGNTGVDCFIPIQQFSKNDSSINDILNQEIENNEMMNFNLKKGSVDFSVDMFANENIDVKD